MSSRLAGKKRDRRRDDDDDDEKLEHSLHSSSRACAVAQIHASEQKAPTMPSTRRNKKGGVLLTAKADVIQLNLSHGRKFKLVPNCKKEWRKSLYTAGASGSGKSEFTASWARSYAGLFPHSKIYGVSHTKFADDPAYKGLQVRQLPVEFFDTSGSPPFTVEHLKEPEGNLVIFDDVDSFEGEAKKAVFHAIQLILNLGRKLNISIIITNHLLQNYSETRGILHGVEWLVVFPHNTQKHELTYFLDKVGVDKQTAHGLRAASQSWLAVHQIKPTCIISETEARMI